MSRKKMKKRSRKTCKFNRRTSKANRGLEFESLENRKLMAGLYADGGTLYAFGGDGNDQIVVTQTGDNSFEADFGDESHGYGSNVPVTELIFIGGNGDDVLVNNTDLPSRMYGNAGNDQITGGSGDDIIVANEGDDWVDGREGSDKLYGMQGNDTLLGSEGNDKIFGVYGSNQLEGGEGNDLIYGGDANDIIKGDAGADQMFGGAGDDEIHAGEGIVGATEVKDADFASGYHGRDKFFGGNGLNIFWGGSGDDEATGGSGVNRLHGLEGNDVLIGGSENDYISGHEGNDRLIGHGGEDYILGGDGNDFVESGQGQDYVHLGTGDEDLAEYEFGYENDRIRTFNGGQSVLVEASESLDRVFGAENIQFNDIKISTDQAFLSAVEKASLDLMNAYRGSRGLNPFSVPTDVTNYARNWTDQMAKVGLKDSPDAEQKRLLVDGRILVGENVILWEPAGHENQSAEAVAKLFHDSWKASPTHHPQMIHPDLTEIGIGIKKIGGVWYGTHNFTG